MASFKELRFNYKGLWASLAGSYIFHLILIVVLFHFYTRSSQVVVPHVVNGGSDAHGTHLYWLQGNRGSEFLRKQLVTSDRIVSKGKGNILRFDRNLPRKDSNKKVVASF